MTDFTPTQGRYLSFIHAYITRRGYSPAEAEVAAALCVSAPSVNQMIKMLEKKGLILRQPGQPRSLRILIPADEIPPWRARQSTSLPAQPAKRPARPTPTEPAPSANLFVLLVFLTGGPVSPKFADKEISRLIEIRGDQTLAQLHQAIFAAYDRWEEHLYEFQLGTRPFDPEGATYGLGDRDATEMASGDARATRLDDLDLKPGRIFGYWFDFGDGWFHQIAVERVEKAIPTVTYPRVARRVGKSPPQYSEQ